MRMVRLNKEAGLFTAPLPAFASSNHTYALISQQHLAPRNGILGILTANTSEQNWESLESKMS